MNIREALEKHAWSYDEMGRLALIGKEDFRKAEEEIKKHYGQVLIELAELKALYVTDMVVAMQEVCETAKMFVDNYYCFHDDDKVFIEALEQALQALEETKKGEKR